MSTRLVTFICFKIRDNIPTVRLQDVPLAADLFEDDVIHGVKPILFAEDPAAATEAMLANLELAQRDVVKLQKILFAPESISPAAAVQVPRNSKL